MPNYTNFNDYLVHWSCRQRKQKNVHTITRIMVSLWCWCQTVMSEYVYYVSSINPNIKQYLFEFVDSVARSMFSKWIFFPVYFVVVDFMECLRTYITDSSIRKLCALALKNMQFKTIDSRTTVLYLIFGAKAKYVIGFV